MDRTTVFVQTDLFEPIKTWLLRRCSGAAPRRETIMQQYETWTTQEMFNTKSHTYCKHCDQVKERKMSRTNAWARRGMEKKGETRREPSRAEEKSRWRLTNQSAPGGQTPEEPVRINAVEESLEIQSWFFSTAPHDSVESRIKRPQTRQESRFQIKMWLRGTKFLTW